MKKILIIGLIIVLIVLFGTFPLSILSYIFTFVGKAFGWLAKILNVFGWNGII